MLKYLLFIFALLGTLQVFSQQKTGMASYYHSKFVGRKTASGDIFSNKKMTAASNHYKLGEWVKVTNIANGKSVYVLINDRMAQHSGRLIDLSHQAAENLSFIGKGLCKVCVEKSIRPNDLHDPRAETRSDSLANPD